MDDGLIVYGCRLVIPAKMRHEILSKLHESHQGSVRTKQRARLSVYWPGIDNCIDSVILSCKHCQERLPSNPKKLLVVKPRPARPFQEIAMVVWRTWTCALYLCISCPLTIRLQISILTSRSTHMHTLPSTPLSPPPPHSFCRRKEL